MSPRPRLRLALASLVLAAFASPCLADTAWPAREKSVKDALKSKDEGIRMGAFDALEESDDPRAVDLVIWGVEQVDADQARIKKEQQANEKEFESVLNEQEENRKWFRSTGGSARDLDRYNAAERRIAKAREAALQKGKELENSYARSRRLAGRAVQVLAGVLARLPAEAADAAAVKVEAAWLDRKRPQEAVLWIDSVVDLDRPAVGEAMRKAVGDPSFPFSVRVPALEALGARRDPKALEIALSMLEKGESEFPIVAAAMAVLRRLHERAAIDPLITFLSRDDLRRLREDARDALVSLTGQTHGPYGAPWRSWWTDAKDRFVMPEKPTDPRTARVAAQGVVTFYGLTTFSDRVLFILDISGSMEQPAHTGPSGEAGPTRIEVARKELAGAVHNLNEGYRFNVVLFNHEVLTWQPGKMALSNEGVRKQAVRWAEEREPLGGTNIHDALEVAFAAAMRGDAGEPEVDTVLFMTDGRPTAGKLHNPDLILEEVRAWNRIAKLKIHCVGVGEHDEAFLTALSVIGDGEYVKR